MENWTNLCMIIGKNRERIADIPSCAVLRILTAVKRVS